LLGTLGRGSDWFCGCHHGALSADWQRITQTLRENDAIVSAVLDIRACGSSFYGRDEVYRTIQRRLIAAGRRDLLLGAADATEHNGGQMVVKQWLARLERELLDLTGATKKLEPHTPQTAAVPTPQPAAAFIETPTQGEA
jgi:hypothetical protein